VGALSGALTLVDVDLVVDVLVNVVADVSLVGDGDGDGDGDVHALAANLGQHRDNPGEQVVRLPVP
jgi:hypothetical protein